MWDWVVVYRRQERVLHFIRRMAGNWSKFASYWLMVEAATTVRKYAAKCERDDAFMSTWECLLQSQFSGCVIAAMP